MKTANNRLSLAVSALWRFRTAEPDPMGDPSGDCGDLIIAYERGVALKIIEESGYMTPGEYNKDLRSRMVGPDGKMSYRVYEFLTVLEIENVCPNCESALEVWAHRTKSYGGGWDTFISCPNCEFRDVYV